MKSGEPLTVAMSVQDGRTIHIRVWRLQVGRIFVYMLDTNNNLNAPEDRTITDQLYGGDNEHRLKQEIVLGIGGVRAAESHGIQPAVFHMNEGHSAFVTLERIRLLKEEGLSHDEARLLVQSTSVFTTHTRAYPQATMSSPHELMYQHMSFYARELGMSMEDLLSYGRIRPENKSEGFCMTVLALKNSAYSNGVSALHGQVSRKMWKDLYPMVGPEEVPITHITNGVHIPSWISDRHGPALRPLPGTRNGLEDPDNEKVWERIDPDPRRGAVARPTSGGGSGSSPSPASASQGSSSSAARSGTEIERGREVLDPDALTIGFARRFATYKRADLHSAATPSGCTSILNNPERPGADHLRRQGPPQGPRRARRSSRQLVQLLPGERVPPAASSSSRTTT
ncbi:MAG: alpha-glucan family phosphorylase [Rhodopseudomonas palustris]|nr:alpha-glucan family phosphorylase [Rhodopseudomonas palustris]